MSMASLIFLLFQFSSSSRIFTSFIEHWWPLFNLQSLTGDRGWWHDRCSLIRVPNGIAVSPMRCCSGHWMSYSTPHFPAVSVLSFGCTSTQVLIGLWYTGMSQNIKIFANCSESLLIHGRPMICCLLLVFLWCWRSLDFSLVACFSMVLKIQAL